MLLGCKINHVDLVGYDQTWCLQDFLVSVIQDSFQGEYMCLEEQRAWPFDRKDVEARSLNNSDARRTTPGRVVSDTARAHHVGPAVLSVMVHAEDPAELA